MLEQSCRDTWKSAPGNKKAEALDSAHPHCQCEEHSLRESGGDAVASTDLLARILTSPDGYDLDARTITTNKLTSVYGCGLSHIRAGASDQEILDTIDALVGGQEEEHSLVGAIVFKAELLRSMEGDERWFGVYATDDGDKTHHSDVVGTTPSGPSKSAVQRSKNDRRYNLRDRLLPRVLLEPDRLQLLSKLRQEGL